MISVKTEHPLGESIIHYEPLTTDYTTELRPHLESLHYHSGFYKDRKISREQIWFHKSGRYINPDWPIFERWTPTEYTPELDHVQTEIVNLTKTLLKRDFTPNSMLINRYLKGINIIPKHTDSEHIFGDNPTIAVLSVGATRTIRFTPIEPSLLDSSVPDSIDIKLTDNSLLIMAGTTQKYYTHELLKEPTVETPRYSLTIREHKL